MFMIFPTFPLRFNLLLYLYVACLRVSMFCFDRPLLFFLFRRQSKREEGTISTCCIICLSYCYFFVSWVYTNCYFFAHPLGLFPKTSCADIPM